MTHLKSIALMLALFLTGADLKAETCNVFADGCAEKNRNDPEFKAQFKKSIDKECDRMVPRIWPKCTDLDDINN